MLLTVRIEVLASLEPTQTGKWPFILEAPQKTREKGFTQRKRRAGLFPKVTY